MGQSIESVPAGLATLAPVITKSLPMDIEPPVLLSTSWLADAPQAAQIINSAEQIERATRDASDRFVPTH